MSQASLPELGRSRSRTPNGARPIPNSARDARPPLQLGTSLW